MAEEFGEEQARAFLGRKEFLKSQTTIIGGSRLFHGAPLLALKVASRLNQMVFFYSPEPEVGEVAAKIKSRLFSFIWVPLGEVNDYIKKSTAVLIGPGLMRFGREKESKKYERKRFDDEAGRLTKKITEGLLSQFPQKQWVIDAGSLQVMEEKFIPSGAILTLNFEEYRLLFGVDLEKKSTAEKEKILVSLAQKHAAILLTKEDYSLVTDGTTCLVVGPGNEGLEKGGMGDALAGLAVALAGQKPSLEAAATALFISKMAAHQLYQKVGPFFNADDLVGEIPLALGRLLNL
ncbi:hypothetical protein KBI33_01270 [Candidatus Shapirobacteria bacterium]|nr:hypothetical protein [Candidatus Shapirobacteria bacterium]